MGGVQRRLISRIDTSRGFEQRCISAFLPTCVTSHLLRRANMAHPAVEGRTQLIDVRPSPCGHPPITSSRVLSTDRRSRRPPVQSPRICLGPPVTAGVHNSHPHHDEADGIQNKHLGRSPRQELRVGTAAPSQCGSLYSGRDQPLRSLTAPRHCASVDGSVSWSREDTPILHMV